MTTVRLTTIRLTTIRLTTMRRADVASLRAAWWAARSIRTVRGNLRRDGVQARVPDPPRLPASAVRGVRVVLARQPASCLERALVLQRWLLAQGEPFDVVIGVRREDGAFTAHAWVDQVDPSSPERFTELHRLPAR